MARPNCLDGEGAVVAMASVGGELQIGRKQSTTSPSPRLATAEIEQWRREQTHLVRK